jgi:type IV secretory pathway TrbL component
MDPVLANLNLSPPKQRVFARGLLPALVAHVLLAVALAANVNWKRTPDPSKVVAVPGVNTPDSTATAGGEPGTAVTGERSTIASAAGGAAAPSPAAGAAPSPAAPRAAPQRPAEPSQRIAMGAPAAPPSTQATVRPSFDCAKARSRAERLICADPELARLDRELGQLHARAKAAAPDAAAFRRENDAQWRRRETSCFDRECLLAWYAQRRAQLEARLEQTAVAR